MARSSRSATAHVPYVCNINSRGRLDCLCFTSESNQTPIVFTRCTTEITHQPETSYTPGSLL
ncbi:hypothetical protein M404DRAFT_1006607 [Pisolithus tinctorius Marx 270]|uniref:Uncharacterized protein n=1 Tax=Pisolithus tinctorius Marx 270 TaxID=870435 RepID=A0A0C3N690_PISTI|nr:hypothetical protein M404DRAFT_1006607 [Pisolithus tinctorius Marx 270]